MKFRVLSLVFCLFLFCFGMEKREEQRSVIKFMQKSGATPTQTWRRLQTVFSGDTFSKTTVRNWHKSFAEGCDSVKDVKRSGRPRSARTEANIQHVRAAVETERTCTISDLSQHLKLSDTAVRTILKTDLKMSKLCPKFIPKLLSDEQKQFRVKLCLENLARLREDNSLLTKIITGDESWVSVQELPLKKDSKEWHLRGGTPPLKAIQNRSACKTMVTVFFNMQGPVHTEFMPVGQTITAEAYCETLKRLKERVQCKCSHLWELNAEGDRTFILQHDNASSHTAVPTLALIGSSGIQMIAHPPYSPDLTPCDFFLFPRMKAELRGQRFRGRDEVQTAVKEALKNIGPEEFQTALETLPVCWMKYVKSEGQYFEGMHLTIDPEEHDLEFSTEDSELDEQPSDSDSDSGQ